MKQYYVYMLASGKNGTLYTGVTSDLIKRVYEHKSKAVDGFTKKYGADKLVYFETTISIESAIAREKQLKSWNRQWKMELIESKNSDWEDLYKALL